MTIARVSIETSPAAPPVAPARLDLPGATAASVAVALWASAFVAIRDGGEAIAVGGGGHYDIRGVLLCLLAALLYAAGVLVQKPSLRYVDSLTAIWLGCLIGSLVLLPWAPGLVRELAHASARTLVDAVY